MKLNVALCKTCVDFKQQRDFFRGKCLDYEKQIAEKDKLLENVQNELAQVKEMSRNTSSDSQKAIHTPDENQTNNVQIVENEELPLDKVADSPVIPRMRLSKIRKDSEMNSGDQWQLVVPKTEPPDEMDDSSDEDSLPLSKYLAIKMEPEVVLEEGEFNADRDSNEEMEVDMIPENEANTKDLMPLNQRPRYQICRWKIGTDANTAKACGKVCLGTELVSHITTEHMDNMDTLHNNVCMWDYCERYSRQFKLRGDLLRHLYYHIAKANQRCLVDNCGKTFFHKLDLEKHKLSHACGETTSDKKYACTHEGCDKRVMSIEHLRQHLLTHVERDIPCTYPGCNKLFKSTTTLDVHCRKFHIGVEKVTEKESETSAPVTVFPNKPNSCCVDGCSSTSETPKITLHYFPKNPKLRKVWISKLKATKNFTCINRVCSEHFLPSDYYVNRTDQKRRLKPNSVPSQCLP